MFFSISQLNKRVGNLFLRVYLGVLAALIVTLLASILIVNLVNKVRQEAFAEKLLSGFFYSLTNDFAQVAEDQHLSWLAEINSNLNIQIKLQDKSALQLNSRQLNRLEQQRLVLVHHKDLLYVYLPTHLENLVLETHFSRLNAQQASSSIRVLLHTLQKIPQEMQQAKLEELSQSFSYPVDLIHALPTHTDKQQLKRLARGEEVVFFTHKQEHLSSYIQLNATSWIQLGPIATFNFYPPFLLIIIALLGLTVLAASISWFLFNLEKRLRHLERASTQIASGNLRARVKVNGNDFITRLSLAYNRMAEQLQRLLSTQQEMIHAVSHELRTPVARIRFGLQMLEDLSLEKTDNSAALAKQIAGIDQDIDELNTLIDEILTYARLGQEELQLQFERQDALSLAQEIVEAFQRTPSQIKLYFHIDNPQNLSTTADLEARYYQRAIQNLVGNALRYAKTQVKISFLLEEHSLRIDVEDDGPGIPAALSAKVFAPFSRLDDSRTRSSGGYGLGLSIVQRIMFWHKGSALVETSHSLKGAKFSLIFPRHQVVKLTQLKG